MAFACVCRNSRGIPHRLFLASCSTTFRQVCRMACNVSTRDVRAVLESQYGIVPKDVAHMNGYQHLNFKVTLPDPDVGDVLEACNSRIVERGRRLIMKFVDTSHFSYCGNTELQHAVCKHLHANNIVTSLPVVMKSGDTITQFSGGTDPKTYTVQLLTYIEGRSLNEATLEKEELEKISVDLGRLMGCLHQSLMKLDYSVKWASAVYSPFHMQNALEFKDKVDFVTDQRMKLLLTKYFKLFEDNFLPQLGELRKGFIHGDFSDTNVILQQPSDGEDGAWKIAGVIDFEECAYSYLIGDFGICVAYLMLKAGLTEAADPIEVSRLAIEAYQAVIPLTPMEKSVLFEVATSRMVVSYASASFEAFQNPENVEFLFTQARGVPVVLEVIEKTGRSEVERAWFGP